MGIMDWFGSSATPGKGETMGKRYRLENGLGTFKVDGMGGTGASASGKLSEAQKKTIAKKQRDKAGVSILEFLATGGQ